MKGGGIGGAKVNVIMVRLMKKSYLRVVHIILAERTLDVCRQDLHQSELMVIVSAVEIAEEASEKRTYYNNSIYVLKNNQDEVRYVGITNDVGRRKYEHEHDPRHPWRANYKMFVVATGLSREAARTGEQVLISAYTLNALENARREIAVGNVPKFSHHLSTVAELLKIDEIPIALLK